MKPNWKAIGIQLMVLFVIFKIWSAYPVQDFVARFHGYINPKAYEFFHPITERLPSWALVQLMDDGNFNLANNAATDFCKRGEDGRIFFNAVQKMTEHKSRNVRSRAYSTLQCLDKKRAIDFYFSELNRLPKFSPEYRQCLGILHNYKLTQLLPYLLEYASRPEGWRNASCVYLEEYGDPVALPVLYEQRKKDEAENLNGNRQAKYELKRINKAIAALGTSKARQALSKNEQ